MFECRSRSKTTFTYLIHNKICKSFRSMENDVINFAKMMSSNVAK